MSSARDLYARIRESDLYDRKLGMYKVNASLESESSEAAGGSRRGYIRRAGFASYPDERHPGFEPV